jgi:predicted outer membrane protein
MRVMRRLFGILVSSALILGGCRDRAGVAGQTDPNAFVSSLIRGTANDADLALMASRRGQLPETRALAAAIGKESAALGAEVTRMGQQRKLALPQPQDDKRVALKENLSVLRADLFDQAYALAMVQETADQLRTIDAAGRTGDADLRQLALRHRPAIVEEQRAAKDLLAHTGGAPWPGFSP